MRKLIELIKQDKVDILYAIDRTRLSMDYYEATELQFEKRARFKIGITSSNNGCIETNDNTFLEKAAPARN